MTHPSTAQASEPAAPTSTLTYFVGGMDCANCVQKVERMVGTLPGTDGVQTSFTRQTLRLHLDETQTPRGALEHHLRALGYAPSLQAPERQERAAGGQGEHAPVHAAPSQPSPVPWFRTAQGRLVVASGGLLLAAWGLGFASAPLAGWGYGAATLLGVWPLARRAWTGARLGEVFSIETLVTLAALGALLIGEAAEGAVVVFLFAVGELLEGVAAGRARSGIRALAALAPRTAWLWEGGAVREVGAETLQVGQTVQIPPGARVPADGVIVEGHSSLDDSPVTGESVPVGKAPGDPVYAGSINGAGTLLVRAVRTSADHTIARILHLVEEAEASRAPTARFIGRFSRVYTPAVVGVSALVATVPPLLGAPWHEWLYKGLALLLIGCPCALVLSVPAAITSGLSAGARRGLLVKGGAALETIGRVKTVAFDKTGTLTAGLPQVTDVLAADHPEFGPDEVLRLAAAVESGSTHPLARAITGAAASAGLSLPPATGAQAVAGKGVSAQVEGRALFVSSPEFAAPPLSAGLLDRVAALEAQGKTVVVLHDAARALGVLAIRDEPREDARQAVAALRALGVGAVMLTGDNARTAGAIAADLGLGAGGQDEGAVRAHLLPEDKLRAIEELRAHGGVAMVGDGINDAPALARADVGIAMGGGTDVALETADAALLRQRVLGVAELVSLSRATLSNIRQNIAFALGLKAVFLVTTLLGYTGLWLAILADTGATALVTANALRLLRWTPERP